MNKEKLEHYVEFYLCGLPSSSYAIMEVINPATSTKKINSRDPNKVRAPKESFGFRFFDREEYISRNKEVLSGPRKNQSNIYYFGKIVTLENIPKGFPSALISIMEERGYKEVVITRRGNFQSLKKGDVVIDEK